MTGSNTLYLVVGGLSALVGLGCLIQRPRQGGGFPVARSMAPLSLLPLGGLVLALPATASDQVTGQGIGRWFGGIGLASLWLFLGAVAIMILAQAAGRWRAALAGVAISAVTALPAAAFAVMTLLAVIEGRTPQPFYWASASLLWLLIIGALLLLSALFLLAAGPAQGPRRRHR